MVVISHDRKFLDQICTQIVSTERGVSRNYIGNYSAHLEQKSLEQEATKAAFVRQQKELSNQQAYIDRFRASATRSTQAKSREKLLEKVERIEAPLENLGGPIFSFPNAPRCRKQVALIDLAESDSGRVYWVKNTKIIKIIKDAGYEVTSIKRLWNKKPNRYNQP